MVMQEQSNDSRRQQAERICVKEPFRAIAAGLFLTILAVLCIWYGIKFQSIMAWVYIFLAVVFGMPGIITLLTGINKKVLIEGENMIYTSALGKKQSYKLQDIFIENDIYIGIVLYEQSSGKRIGNADASMKGYQQLKDFFDKLQHKENLQMK